MDSPCSIDEKCAEVISVLLRPPSPLQVQEYFDQIISARHFRGINVKQNGEYGKGVYADVEFAEEELILKDQMLVGIQHSTNKVDCLVCSFCFQFIGSIEQQIGRKLYFQDLGVSGGCDNDCCNDDLSSEEDLSYLEYHDDSKNVGTGSSKNVSLQEGVVNALMSGQMKLPLSDKYPLPSPISCPGGCCEAYYCSESCAKEDWETFHSLLCTGERSHSLSRQALGEFVKHANETNDIFLLAAKAISFTILRYKQQKAIQQPKKQKSPNHSPLVEAWKPLSFGYKKRWWDCIALPEDVDPSEETMFRIQIRDLAFTSLQLLKEAIFVEDCEPLFSLEIYGHIIGMFELNNLDLVVASPVEDYFLYIDDLPDSKKIETEEITRPILDALGEEYSACCEGTAFFPLQSCMNHSCCPNAKAFKREEDRDGQATIIALRPIQKEEEITISYIDEDLPLDKRRSLLADYGFSCGCTKCLEESRP